MPMKVLKSIDKALGRLEGWLIVTFLTLMVILTFLHVFFRALYIHGHIKWANMIVGQMDWADPLVRLLVLWTTFLGASLITGENKHIKIDLMSDLLPSRWLPVREVIISAACVLVTGLMVKASVGYIKMEMTFGGRLFLGLPTWVGQLILPVGFCLLLFHFFVRGVGQVIQLVRGDGP
jgi:TRAP-type C4-dicarboxylate transport system permease small subunit